MTKFLAAAAFAALLAAGPVHAQTKIQIGCTATSDCASAMVAVDEGIFKKHGLDAEMVLIGINSNIPAAILSNSIQIGGPTSTVFLQAADGGLDLVAVAGASIMNPSSNANIAAFARNGITIKEPKDFVGKKVGAPGLGAFLHVLFVKWLVEKGVDPKSVNFVEVTFPTMADIIKSGGVDAVLTAEPFVTRMTNAGSRHGRRALRRRTGAHRADHLLCGGARLGREKSRYHQEIPRRDRGRRGDRQHRSRQGLGIDLEIHQAADRAGEGDAAEPVRTGAEGRATRLVDRRHVVAENAADQARSQQS